MQDSAIRTSIDIEEELALVKAKLKSSDSKVSESDLQLSGIYEDQDFNRLSNLSTSLIDLKISEINQRLYPYLADPDRCQTLEKMIVEKDKLIQVLQDREQELLMQVDDFSDQVNQYEVDLNYLINQNNLANLQIKELKNIIEHNSFKEECFMIGSPKTRPNYKLYSELEIANDENSRLAKEIDLVQDKHEELTNKLREAELKYEELLNEITSLKKSNFSCYDEKTAESATVEFYRKVILSLENEVKEFKVENDFLKVKNEELELMVKRNSNENSFVKDLIQELGVAGEKELYKKVLCLAEIAKQSKENRQLIQKISMIISKKTGKSNLSLKEIGNYIHNKLT